MRSAHSKRGVTLVEAVASITVLGIALPPLVGLFTEVAAGSADDAQQRAALECAQNLMEELASKAFEDPALAAGSFGREEAGRAGFDDVDDYDGLLEAPPEDIGGAPVAGSEGLVRATQVDNVTLAAPDPASPEPDGSTEAKRIRVTVRWSGPRPGAVTLATLRVRGGASGDEAWPLDGPRTTSSVRNDQDDEFRFVLVNPQDFTLEIDSFSISADRATPPLEEFQLATDPGDDEKIWEGEASLPTGDLRLNEGDRDERRLPANSGTEAWFKFDEDLDPGPITFTVVLRFRDGSSATLTFPMVWQP